MGKRTTGRAAAEAAGAVITIRRGGGLDAATFAADLSRMYLGYADRRHWTAGIRHATVSDGGYEEVMIHVAGPGSYDRLKYETGTHRAQRVPLAEAGGRVQTCLARVRVLPFPDPDQGQSSLRRGAPPEEGEVKIRTYNFPHGRVTDHRLALGAQPLARVLEGDLDALLDALENTDH
jgi:protein subunit release factor A